MTWRSYRASSQVNVKRVSIPAWVPPRLYKPIIGFAYPTSRRSPLVLLPFPCSGQRRETRVGLVWTEGMGMAFGILYAFLLLVLSTSLYLRRRKRRPEDKYKVPPGSMGWPYVGETLQLYSEDPSVFFATRQKRFRCARVSLCEFEGVTWCMRLDGGVLQVRRDL